MIKKLRKTILPIMLALTLLLGTMSPLTAAGNIGGERPPNATVGIILNGEYVQPIDQGPFIDRETGRTMVPLRFISESLGYRVDWNSETQTVTIDGDLAHVIGTNIITRLNTGEVLTFDAPSWIVRETGRTVVPLRFIAEALNATVDWDEANRDVIIWQAGFEPLELEGDMPYIRVLTPFPEGTVANLFIDIEYIAVPSRNAHITDVFFTTNDSIIQYIYVSGTMPYVHHEEPRGTLGRARIPFFMGENNIVITVRDSSGYEACFIVEQVPFIEMNNLQQYPPILESEFMAFESNGLDWVATNRLMIGIVRQRDHITMEHIADVAATINGVIIGYSIPTGSYTIEVPVNTADGLRALGEQLIAAFPDVVALVSLYGGSIAPQRD
jgi:hypothetical protein